MSPDRQAASSGRRPSSAERAPREKKQDAYSVLRRDIVELRLKPGTTASIRDLCGHFHISRSPMRDALIRLGEEGLVDLLPQRGITISRIDLGRVEEERFLRISVERNVMREFMEHHSPEDVAFLQASIVKQKRNLPTKDYRANMTLDDEFHRYFYRVTGKTLCADVVWKASGHYSRVRLLTCVDRDISQQVVGQHCDFVEAVGKGDTEGLLTAFDHHLSRIGAEVRQLGARYPDLFLPGGAPARGDDPLKDDFLETLKA